MFKFILLLISLPPLSVFAASEVAPPQTRKEVQVRLKPLVVSPEITCIKKKGYIRVAIIEENYPPFVYKDEKGNFAGININIARRIAKSMGAQAMFDRTAKTADALVELISSGKADMGIARLQFDTRHADRVHYTTGYAEITRAFLINRLLLAKAKGGTQKSLRSLLNNPDMRIGILEGSPNIPYIKENIPNTTLVEFASWEDIERALLNGELIAGFRDEITARKTIENNPNLALKLLSVRLKEERLHYRMVLPWSSGGLLGWVNSYLDNAKYFYNADQLLKAAN